jgi:hypothetical protein
VIGKLDGKDRSLNRCLGAISVRPLPSAYTLLGCNGASYRRRQSDALMLIKLTRQKKNPAEYGRPG